MGLVLLMFWTISCRQIIFHMSLNMQFAETLFVRKTVWANVFELIMGHVAIKHSFIV